MYTKIVNPYTDIKVSIFFKQGKIVLRSYLDKQSSMKHGGRKALRGGFPLGPTASVSGGPNDQKLYDEIQPESELEESFKAAASAASAADPLHQAAYLGIKQVVNRTRCERLKNEEPFMNYLTTFMAEKGLPEFQRLNLQGAENQATLRKIANNEARRIFNLLSETGISNLQQYKARLFGDGPYILARQGELSPADV